MFCSNCGKQVNDGDRFCSNCGKALVAAPKAAQPNPYTSGTINIIKDHSTGARFRVKCEYCLCEFEYGMGDLGYRAWYPHGFVYCPKCNKPLRHRLEYRVDQ